MTWLLLKVLIRFAVFGLVFGVVAHRSDRVEIRPRLALPVVALVFALLNTGMYWVAKPVLNLATLGTLWVFMPLVLNGAFLWATHRLSRIMRIHMRVDGLATMLRLAVLLTVAHGALYVLLDILLA